VIFSRKSAAVWPFRIQHEDRHHRGTGAGGIFRNRGLGVQLSSAVTVDRVFDDVALLAVEIHDKCLYCHIIRLRSTRPATGVDGASHLLLWRYLDHSVPHLQWFRGVCRRDFAVYEANGSAGIMKVKFGIDRLVALHFRTHADGINYGASTLR
jgi:hypothetical protein